MNGLNKILPTIFIITFPLSLAVPALSEIQLWQNEQGSKSLGVDISGKWSSLSSHAPGDPFLFPERDTWTELFRLRFGFNIKYNDRASGHIAYEQSARWLSDPTAANTSGILPSNIITPYRIEQLNWQIYKYDNVFFCQHEIDRAFVSLYPDWGQVTLGRQAIGLGRGKIFSAVDVFAPFSTLEFDREWRRGIDAVRIERYVSDTSSVELIGAFGQTWEQSAILGRFRGYWGDIDAEIIFGKRAEDTMYAGTISGLVGDAEAHAEMAFFSTPEAQIDGGFFGNDHLVCTSVVGGSYTFSIGNGLTFVAEYHYSGFGVENIRNATVRLTDMDFTNRLLRGDLQIIGRQAIALQFAYPINTNWNSSLLYLQSPIDGSGIIAPSLIWDISSSTSCDLSFFIPWGNTPIAGNIQSEYGSSPLAMFFQLRAYY
jgi:hypothetical protein